MMPEERCPYCGSEELICESNRIDWNGDELVNSDTMQCPNCGGKIIIQTEYAPIIRFYYDGYEETLVKKEVVSNE